MYISCHLFFTTWTIYLILYSSKFLSNLIICDVKMSNKKKNDSILLVSFTSVFSKSSDVQYISERPKAELRTNFWTRLYQNSMWRVRNIFWARLYKKKKSGKKNYVVFFSVFVLGEKVCIIRQNSKSSHLQIHVSLRQPICLQ